MMNIGFKSGSSADILDDQGKVKPEHLPDGFAGYVEVDTFADLPSPIGNNGSTYFVTNSTGSYLLMNKKPAGIYECDGSSWNYLGNEVPTVSQTEINQGVSDGVRRMSVTQIVEIMTRHSPSASSFETVSKNLKGYPADLVYTNGILTSVIYDLGIGDTITKNLIYTNGMLTAITLTGTTPVGINLTKHLNYVNGILENVYYS